MAESSSDKSRTMIRIYPSFTEIREDVHAQSPHKVYIPQDLHNNIMPGSLNLEGVNVHTMDAVLRENNLEGKEKEEFLKIRRARWEAGDEWMLKHNADRKAIYDAEWQIYLAPVMQKIQNLNSVNF